MISYVRMLSPSLIALALAGCVNSLGGHTLLGQPRPKSDASKVVLYATAPEGAVVIGQVAARSTVFRSEVAKTEAALDELKDQAAAMGANGIVLDAGEDAVLGKKPGIVITPDKLADFVTDQDHDVLVSGTAIYVPEPVPNSKPQGK